MPLADQARTLRGLGAKMRREIHGIDSQGEQQSGRMWDPVTQTATSETFACYFSAVRSQEQLDEVGFKQSHDTILRVDKSEPHFLPVIGKSVMLLAANQDGTDVVVTLNEQGGHSAQNPEHIFGCGESA